MDQSQLHKIKDLISNNHLGESIQKLMALTGINQLDIFNEVVLQSRKLIKLETDERRGVVSRNTYNMEESVIANNLICLIDKINNYQKINNNHLDTNYQKVEILIEGNIYDFDTVKRENLIESVASILRIKKDLIKIKKVMEGSIKVIMELPKEEAEELVRLFKNKYQNKLSLFDNINSLNFAKNKKIKIMVADQLDEEIDKLYSFLQPVEDMQVVASAKNGSQLLQIIKIKPIDLIILDFELPDMNSIKAISQLRQTYPDVKILINSNNNIKSQIPYLFELGVYGYIAKNSNPLDLIEAIHTVMEDKLFVAPPVPHISMEITKEEFNSRLILTKREVEILQLISKGLSSQAIGQTLYISKHTVETHRKNIQSKLNVKSTTDLVRYALKFGLA